MSWKDVRKHAKDSGGDGGGGVEVETLEDGADGKLPYVLSLCNNFDDACLIRQVDYKGPEDHN